MNADPANEHGIDREALVRIATEAATTAVTKTLGNAQANGSSKSMGDVLDGLVTDFNKPTETALSDRQRRFYAFCGALPWVV